MITSGRPLGTELVLVKELTLGRRHAIAHELGIKSPLFLRKRLGAALLAYDHGGHCF
jgi:hypothetical protein